MERPEWGGIWGGGEGGVRKGCWPSYWGGEAGVGQVCYLHNVVCGDQWKIQPLSQGPSGLSWGVLGFFKYVIR